MSETLAGKMDFFRAGLLKQVQTGAVVPSQRFLIAKMISAVPEGYRGQIVELGAGTGAMTLPLAARCREARILACEINPTLARHNRHNLARAGLTERVEVLSDSAEKMLAEISRNESSKVDYVVSGLPLGNMSRKRSLMLIDAIRESLRPGGLYIQFQYSLLHRKKIQVRFKSLRTSPVFLNFPPAVVYYAHV